MKGTFTWRDRTAGEVVCDPSAMGDVVLARKDVPNSYHLAVTVDDAVQGVTLVTRGRDLLEATHIHRLLQVLLGYGAPDYFHHDLLTGDDGERLAKRDQSITIRHYRQAGMPAKAVRALTGFD
jgi:glutamyl-Q tRNA(Asp) synthetase